MSMSLECAVDVVVAAATTAGGAEGGAVEAVPSTDDGGGLPNMAPPLRYGEIMDNCLLGHEAGNC